MATNETQANASSTAPPVAKEAPTEQQVSQPGVPKRFVEGQTVCNEKNEKGKLCNGHLKETSPINVEARKYLRGDDLLYKCQSCGALYAGPTLGHVRDPFLQRRYVMSEQNDILLAAGGTLPAFRRTETGALVPATEPTSHATTPKLAPEAAAKPATTTTTTTSAPQTAAQAPPADETPEQKRARKLAEAQARKANSIPIPGASGPPPEGETHEQKIARLQAVVAEVKRRKEAAGDTLAAAPPPTAGTDSSPAADAHRPAAEAQAATGQASAAPLSPAAATASPAAGAETVSDLAPQASTELTPGAPADERPSTPRAAARRAAPTALNDRGMPLPPPHLAPPAGETHQQKIARLQAVVGEAKRRAGKE